MIIDAVIPLLVRYGRDVTSKQIAEAAGIAEGTIFRAFGDKETLIRAAVRKYLDPELLRLELSGIDASLPLEEKVRLMVGLLQKRLGDVFRMVAAVGFERPPLPQQREVFARVIAEVLEPELERLNWPSIRVGHIILLVAFAASLPQLNEGIAFTTDELAAIILYGIAGREGPHTQNRRKNS